MNESTVKHRAFKQVDVFGRQPLLGNPLAVVLDGSGLTSEVMQNFARWTNLSETTFLTKPTSELADYAVRIFTPDGELPFAGHPTLGSAHAWIEAGGRPHTEGLIVQECEAGLIEVRLDAEGLAFMAPPTVRSGPVGRDELAVIESALGLPAESILSHQWVDNGPGWLAVEVSTPELLLNLKPDFSACPDLKLGVFAFSVEDSDVSYEVRAFVPGIGVSEDPVTGSLNASLAQWLAREGRVNGDYSVGQGTCLQRDGRVFITIQDFADSSQRDGQKVWVGGRCSTLIDGTVLL